MENPIPQSNPTKALSGSASIWSMSFNMRESMGKPFTPEGHPSGVSSRLLTFFKKVILSIGPHAAIKQVPDRLWVFSGTAWSIRVWQPENLRCSCSSEFGALHKFQAFHVCWLKPNGGIHPQNLSLEIPGFPIWNTSADCYWKVILILLDILTLHFTF